MVYRALWPFSFVVDPGGASVGWAVVNAPVVTPSRQEQLACLRRSGFRFVGMASDGEFPRLASAGPIDYDSLCEAWCHCFRDPGPYIPKGRPTALISASDFTDYHSISPDAVPPLAETPSFDLLYLGARERWKETAKGWELAQRCIPRLWHEVGLRALMVDTPADALPASVPTTRLPLLPWPEFLAHLARCRFLLVTGTADASPRVIAEALCLDVPVLVHRGILGGWKYVNSFTGAFFDDDQDVARGAQACLEKHSSPRRWFRANYGPYLTGQRLLALLRPLDPALTRPTHLALSEALDVLPSVSPP